MIRFLLLFVMLCAACGLVLSLAVNAASFAGFAIGEGILFKALLWGIFPTFLTVILIGRSKRNKRPDVPDREIDHWELVLAGSPVALRYLFWGCFAYAFVLGIVFSIEPTQQPHLVARGTSAFFMMFYTLGLAATMAALRRGAF